MGFEEDKEAVDMGYRFKEDNELVVCVNVHGSSNSKKQKKDDNGWITHSGHEVEDEFPMYSATHRFT